MAPRTEHPTSDGRGPLLLTFLAAVLVPLTAGGCSGILGLGGDRVDSALDRWRSNRPAHYQFTYRNRCFCAGTEPVVVTVVGDSVAGVTPVAGGGAPPLPESSYRTVDGLFALIAEWRDRDPVHTHLEFHDRLGYPTDVFFDFRANIADEEQGFEISDLRALERLE
mgnify:CR=1 FL=1